MLELIPFVRVSATARALIFRPTINKGLSARPSLRRAASVLPARPSGGGPVSALRPPCVRPASALCPPCVRPASALLPGPAGWATGACPLASLALPQGSSAAGSVTYCDSVTVYEASVMCAGKA